jgi:hypothetical protein
LGAGAGDGDGDGDGGGTGLLSAHVTDVTARADGVVTVHVMPPPEHAPPHPLKMIPLPGIAVNVTVVPAT